MVCFEEEEKANEKKEKHKKSRSYKLLNKSDINNLNDFKIKNDL